MEPFIGEIRLLPFTYAPVGWLICDGSLQALQAYQALYAIIGTTYGGDGVKNFALPDLRGYVPVGANSPISGTVRVALGKTTGTANVTLTAGQLPLHNHTMNGNTTTDPNFRLAKPAVNARPGAVVNSGTGMLAFSDSQSPDTNFAPQAIGPDSAAATASAHSNQQPYLSLNFMIATDGVFPDRP